MAARKLLAELKPWAFTASGVRVDKILLTNSKGMSLEMTNWGATILSVKAPSKVQAEPEELTLCYGDLAKLQSSSPFYGSTVGRVANRIARGSFAIDGKRFQLATNNGENHLHGGLAGFDKAVWVPRLYAKEGAVGVEFRYTSHDGEEGYPGAVDVVADYSLTEDNTIAMTFSATADKATPINICNHTYWNLAGNLKAPVAAHVLQLACTHFLPVGATQIPTGEIAPVAGGPMDFTAPKPVGRDLAGVDGGGEPGYDHCFCRGGDASRPAGLAEIARLEDPVSGRRMIVSTDQPAVQLYTGNFLSKAAGDAPHLQHGALCLETQTHPDAINQAGFPSVLLRPGEVYRTTTVHAFEW